MKNARVYRAKDIETGEWVCGNYVDNTHGCVPLIITGVWARDDEGLDFEYHYVDRDSVEIVKRFKPTYTREKTYLCPNDCGGEDFDEWGEVPHCPDCGHKFNDLDSPNFCPDCGFPLDWTR